MVEYMKKKILVVGIIVIFVILIIPRKWDIDDGGSVNYSAILYSVTNYHAINGEGGFYTGIEVKILGETVFDNTTFDD